MTIKMQIVKDALVEWKDRNKCILAQADRPFVRQNRVNLHYYDIPQHNIGDALSPVIYQNMCTYYGLDPEKEIAATKHLYAIGSILFFGYQSCVVWGSGFLTEQQQQLYILHRLLQPKMDIRAVRGPKSRELLIKWGGAEVSGSVWRSGNSNADVLQAKYSKDKRLYCG